MTMTFVAKTCLRFEFNGIFIISCLQMTEMAFAVMSSDKNIRPLQLTCIWHYILCSFCFIGRVTADKRMSAVMTHDDFVYLFGNILKQFIVPLIIPNLKDKSILFSTCTCFWSAACPVTVDGRWCPRNKTPGVALIAASPSSRGVDWKCY